MRTLWTDREIAAPASVLWDLLTDLDRWPEWGPSLRSAELDNGEFGTGATGALAPIVGPSLRFEITDVVDGASWAWKVAGVPATEHRVESLGPDRCRAGFGVPLVAAPYLAVCRVALRRLERLATNEEVRT